MLHMQQLCELIVVSGQELAVFDSFATMMTSAFTHVPRAHARRATRGRTAKGSTAARYILVEGECIVFLPSLSLFYSICALEQQPAMGKHAETLDFVDYYAVLAALTCCSPSAVALMRWT